ncbi:hypothetical protein ACHAWT_009141 [Skeletonema menzelii]
MEDVNELKEDLEARASLAADDDASMHSFPSLPEVPAVVTDKKSINDYYPTLEGKSKKQIPITVIRLLGSDAEKHNFCLKWSFPSENDEVLMSAP